MAKDDWNRTSSLPPETTEIDGSWDDDALDASLRRGLRRVQQLPDEDRATVVPDLPMAELARVLMASAEPSVPPSSPPREATDRPTPLFDPELSLDEFGNMVIDTGPPTHPVPRTRPGLAPERASHGVEHVRVRATAPSQGPRSLPAQPPSLAPGWADAELEVSIGDLDMSLDELDLGPESLRPLNPRPSEPIPHLGLEPRARAQDPELERAHKEMADRFAVGDFSGALVIAETVLEQHPDDGDARRYAQSCRDVLIQMYSAKLGRLDQLISVAVPADQIRWLSLDHRAGFFLSLVDGSSSIEELLDICGMPRLDALRILFNLHEQRIVTLSPRNASG